MEKSKIYLQKLLSNNVLNISFTKKDGTERIMKCTLIESVVTATNSTKESTRASNDSLIHVYDLEKQGWRSIIIDNIKFYEVVE